MRSGESAGDSGMASVPLAALDRVRLGGRGRPPVPREVVGEHLEAVERRQDTVPEGTVHSQRVQQQDGRALAGAVQHRLREAHRRSPAPVPRTSGSSGPPGAGVRAVFMTVARVE